MSKRVGQVQVLVVIVWTFKVYYLYKCVIAGLSAILMVPSGAVNGREFRDLLSD
jgi:hypothetical protein